MSKEDIKKLENERGYRQKTPFEIFLQHTSEKEESARALAIVLERLLSNGEGSVLDIGSGVGEYLGMALQHIDYPRTTHFVLLEPSTDHLQALRERAREFADEDHVQVIEGNLEEYPTDKQYDVAVAAHLYHISEDARREQFNKMLELVKVGGTLIFVMRSIDEVYAFKEKFKTKLFGSTYKAQTVESSVEVFETLTDFQLEITVHQAHAVVRFPLDNNMEDTKAIIEFYLNKKWEDISDDIQDEILAYLRERSGELKIVDGVAEITKVA